MASKKNESRDKKDKNQNSGINLENLEKFVTD